MIRWQVLDALEDWRRPREVVAVTGLTAKQVTNALWELRQAGYVESRGPRNSMQSRQKAARAIRAPTRAPDLSLAGLLRSLC